jgi:L-lactate permease
MMWQQVYDPFGKKLLSTAISALPVLTLFFVLIGLKKRVWVAALSGLVMAVALALLVFKMPAVLVTTAAAHGFIFGLLRIAWIVVGSIFLYNVASEAGQFQIMKDSIAGLSSDKRLQLVLIAFCFGAFLEGSTNAQHTWQGFSTGEWEGDKLKVTTTHLKEGWLRRNGLPRSEKATLVEYFIRHGNFLTLVTVVKDPVYLTEPWVRTSNWVADPGFQLSPFSCIPNVEIERPRGSVPHHLPGSNPFLTEFATKHGIPQEASRGGAETMYPEFLPRLRK